MTSRRIFDVPSKKREIEEIEQESLASDFYSDRIHAQRQMRQLSRLRDEVVTWEGLATRLSDLAELSEMLDEEPDERLAAELVQEVNAVETELEKRRMTLLLNGEHDTKSAIISIHAGNGGTDAQDWTEMMERMYMRWAESHGYKVELLDEAEGEEAGLKSVTFSVDGPYAYGYLRGEAGAHRLIRLSPFDAAHRRQTSFAKVEVMPDIGDAPIEIVVRPEDIEVDTFRSTGKGGPAPQQD